jgi:hypothetical protein
MFIIVNQFANFAAMAYLKFSFNANLLDDSETSSNIASFLQEVGNGPTNFRINTKQLENPEASTNFATFLKQFNSPLTLKIMSDTKEDTPMDLDNDDVPADQKHHNAGDDDAGNKIVDPDHEQMTFTEGKYKCNYCNKRAKSRSRMRKHVLRRHEVNV